jgi:hypothetical protein
MSDPLVESLRPSLEAWERQAAAYWDSVIRSPDVLRRISRQTNLTLDTYRRITQTLERAGLPTPALYEGAARELYLLERIERQLDALAARIADLESRLDGRP